MWNRWILDRRCQSLRSEYGFSVPYALLYRLLIWTIIVLMKLVILILLSDGIGRQKQFLFEKEDFFVWWLQHHWLIPLVLLALTFDYHWNTIVESDVQIGGDFSNGMTENAIQRGIWNSRVTDPITLNSYIGSSHLS